MRKPAGEHSLASEGGWLGLEFDVAAEILLKGDCPRSPTGKVDENRDALPRFVSLSRFYDLKAPPGSPLLRPADLGRFYCHLQLQALASSAGIQVPSP